MPVHDPGPWLSDTLASVRSQTFTDWELVVVDDGSVDDVAPVVGAVPGATLLRQEPAGASVARNRGVLATGGELVAFMDHDDLWVDNKLEHQVAALERHPTAGLAYCDVAPFRAPQAPELHRADDAPPVVEVDLVPPGDRGPVGGDEAASRLAASLEYFGRSFVVPSSVLVRRSWLADSGLVDPSMPFTGDLDLLIRLGALGGVAHVRSRDVWYRTHETNYSLRYDEGRRELRQMRQRYVQLARARRDWRLLRQAESSLRRPRRLYAWQALDRARGAWRARDLRSTGYHLARSAAFDPWVLASSLRHRPRVDDAGRP